MRLRIEEAGNFEEQRMAVQGALILGFGSESATFPIASEDEGMAIPKSYEELEHLIKNQEKEDKPTTDYIPASHTPGELVEFDWRKRKGLESLFGIGEFLKDHNQDLLPDTLNFHIIVPENLDASILRAACDIAFRFGMEVTCINRWLLVKEYTKGNAVIFTGVGECGIKLLQEEQGNIVEISGRGDKLEKLICEICENFPYLSHFDTWARRLQNMTDSFAMNNLDGQAAYLQAAKYTKGIKAYVSPEIETRRNEMEEMFPKVMFVNHKGMKKVYEKEYDISWEVDDLYQLLEDKVYSRIKNGDRIVVEAALSEEVDVRNSVAKEIEARLLKHGAGKVDMQIICSYKQGYSWIEEVLLPKLKQSGRCRGVTIYFKAFLPEGVTQWKDENGATPSYNNLNEETPDKWYDLPIRYLQELYPVEDLIVRELGIEKANIDFQLYEGDEDITYQILAVGEEEEMLLRESYKAAYHERPYLNKYPGMGVVHPSTGYIKVMQNDKELLDERIESDTEKVWEIYQQDILKDCRNYVEEKTKGNITVEEQPFFARLCVEAVLSEPDYLLSSRNDMISILDALHEDIYFAGSDFFKNYGMEKCGKMLEEPGLILPVIKKGVGKPKLRVTLYNQNSKESGFFCEDKKIASIKKREDIELFINEITEHNEKLSIKIKAKGVDEEVVASFVTLLNEKKVMQDVKASYIDQIVIEINENSYCASLEHEEALKETLSIQDIDLHEDEVIGYEEYISIINQLKKVPNIAVYKTADSYLGREIYGIELLPNEKGYVSRTKRITNHISEIINCRHHANEVSSTNAAFLLLRQLLTDSRYKNLANQLNLVIVPMENVDGSAIHYELQKDNPHWKLHVARFNAIGKEFYHEHFKPDTKHTEAMGLTRLFETFAPDIIVDNHGVPTHEWEQQFAGYTSPSFKGFWLPRSLLYGYFWYVTNEEYKSNYPVNKKMEDVIADAIGEHLEMKNWNKEWAQQFEKYAHSWMPKLFPADYYKEMINYWIPFDASATHRYPSIRFPWITTVAYTSEVADETAQGAYLNLCARAHVTHDLATINMLINATCIYENKAVIAAETMDICHTRIRPIVVEA